MRVLGRSVTFRRGSGSWHRRLESHAVLYRPPAGFSAGPRSPGPGGAWSPPPLPEALLPQQAPCLWMHSHLQPKRSLKIELTSFLCHNLQFGVKWKVGRHQNLSLTTRNLGKLIRSPSQLAPQVAESNCPTAPQTLLHKNKFEDENNAHKCQHPKYKNYI